MVGELLGETIKSAIAQKILNIFTPAPIIYKEKIYQGFITPCFFIWIINVTQTKLLMNSYTRDYLMNIRYHISEKDTKTYEKLALIGNTLLAELTKIEVPIFFGTYDIDNNPIEALKPVYGKNIEFKITEDILQFFVTYTIRCKPEKITEPIILTSETNINTK
jgi:hypothetical protein